MDKKVRIDVNHGEGNHSMTRLTAASLNILLPLCRRLLGQCERLLEGAKCAQPFVRLERAVRSAGCSQKLTDCAFKDYFDRSLALRCLGRQLLLEFRGN